MRSGSAYSISNQTLRHENILLMKELNTTIVDTLGK